MRSQERKRPLRLYRQLIGRVPYGDEVNFNSNYLSSEEFVMRVAFAKQNFLTVRPLALFCPRPAFTNKVAVLEKNTEAVMSRTNDFADGGIVIGERNAIAFFTGDCPIVVLIQGEKMAVLHAGYRNLIRQNPDEPSIIEVAIKEHFDPLQTRAYVGLGIGPCCWVPEYENKPEILNPAKSRYPALLKCCLCKTTSHSPFGPGYTSVDLYKLARGLLLQVGLSENTILVRNQCTCCARDRGSPTFWSHTRFKAHKDTVDGRNMAIAFLTDFLEADGFEKIL